MRTSRTTLCALVMLLLATPCGAVDHLVYVDDGSFEPKVVTINLGDTITFKELGTQGAHNVHADDDSFRCSVGCRGDGSGATGDPSKQNWSDTLTFNKAGVISYACDPHRDAGMVGSITVLDTVASTFAITPGISGNWFNPTSGQDGHGVQFEILPDHGILAIWFVFTPDGSGQTWLYAQGAYDPSSNTVTVPAYLSLGAKFPPNFTHADDHVTQWGTLTFTFTDCNNGMLSWTSTATGYPASGSLPITRATSIAGTTCP
jgi:plastocyanin